MYNACRLLNGIKEHDRLAVCLLDHQTQAGQVCDQGVIAVYLEVFTRIPVHMIYL